MKIVLDISGPGVTPERSIEALLRTNKIIEARCLGTYCIAGGCRERGAHIIVNQSTCISEREIISVMWDGLKQEFPQIKCAYLDIGGHFSGCIIDYLLNTSKCPNVDVVV